MTRHFSPRCWRASPCCRALFGLLGVAALALPAAAQTPEPPAAPPADVAPAPPPAPAPSPSPAPAASPTVSVTVGTPPSASTDHDTVVGHWGIEARRLASPLRSPRDTSCGATTCPVDLNALSLRRWSSDRYAYTFGLAFALGGGTVREGGESRTRDTFFGIGPTVGARFLLANWQHLAVSAGPQLDFVLFMPSGSGPKTILLGAKGVVEGEVHLGFIGLPALSVGLETGLQANLLLRTSADQLPDAQTPVDWSVGTIGQTALWDLVTKAFLRYYF